MKVLFDENMPWPFRYYLPGHEIWSVDYLGWKSIGNGELLALARDRFDVLITADQRLATDQNISERDIGIIVIEAASNTVADFRPLVVEIVNTLLTIERGEVRRIPSPEL